ncbi:MAG: flippase-like domain-containing protein [Chloroflexota bacterium]|nr:flippase-like domain-containing protein [Chloroflexota bacterium]
MRDPSDRPEAEGIDLGRLAPRLLAGVVLAVLAVSGLLLFGDVRRLGTALREFQWWFLVPAMVLTLWNYALRYLKWQLYLARIGVRGVPLGTSVLVFLSAFALSITPGKLGEFIKCAVLKRLAGTPVSRSTAAVVAERLTDGLAMVLLAAAGAWLFPTGRPVIVAATLLALVAVVLLQRPRLIEAIIDRLPAHTALQRLTDHAEHFLDASGALVGPRLLAIGTGLGVVAWLGECGALFLILLGLGVPATWEVFLIATFVLAVSSLAGALSMLPGGIGVAEASVTAMLLLLVPGGVLDRGEAVAATLLIRFATLWFAVLIGAVALVALRGRLAAATGRQEGRPSGPAGSRHGEGWPPVPVAERGGGRR